ncbi:caspase-3-like [Biomphalaria glabrata]|uniref:Caspase-3-like n=1 Tax=Biomphalaria glabrata TaxID=6526 RepID=A0A9W2ZHW8_BIOGL|nr:caspase-3-like [Biomphalaria glabrata]XP_055874623.1 caspase-3-like [Biomphalaria glabrata]XP_055874624.1 caspase-3-like [Biomphalaria glabrata]XP_055874625.1 caspase-3-like [Biomphalaria glabrata]XP_055874626.1 caspase-3-like [Biomphalaria glabrata]XP_055874627.1 caspase-3-like [Biomphalaria glabrata]
MQSNVDLNSTKLTLESNSNQDFQYNLETLSPEGPKAPLLSRRHRVSCGNLTITSSSAETTGSKIIRSCSSSFSHSSEFQKPVGRYYHLHQQQTQQVQPVNQLEASVLASAVRVAATIGLSVSHSGSGEPPGCDVSPTMSTANVGDLPYILKSVSPERLDVRPGAPSEPNEYNFNFKKRGIFVIINNRHFDEDLGQPAREGSDVDAERLEERFQDLGFEVRRYDDATATKMITLLQEVASLDHSDSDCFGCAILSYGKEGVVYARDGDVSLDLLVQPFKADKCPTLIGKPKLFFIQACEIRRQNLYLDKPPRNKTRSSSPSSPASSRRRSSASPNLTGDENNSDVSPAVHVRKIPIEADCLFCYSTVPGYYSWHNNQDGSWFIQALCIVLENYGTKMEFMHMLTHVNRIVAYEFASCTDKELTDAVKQMPCIVSVLTRYIYFRPKKQDIR